MEPGAEPRSQAGPGPGPGPAPAPPASFSEILRLVRSGQDVPGLHRPSVTASLASPTPSRLARRPKPWERARPAEPPQP